MTSGTRSPSPRDPTRVREQPSLTTASGSQWLLVAGAFALISLIVVVPMITMSPAGLAVGAAIAIVVLYAGMVVARAVIPPGRRRLGTLAAGMLLIAGIALVTVAIVAATAWGETAIAG